MKIASALIALFWLVSPLAAKDAPGLRNATILIIRHAEKPDDGVSLAPAGEERAKAYVKYFENYTIDSKPLKLDAIYSTADSKGSHRPRLTVEPLSKALGLPVHAQVKDKKFPDLVTELEAGSPGRNILICWHHGEIPNLLTALGADASQVLGRDKWPEHIFGWVIQLQYDDHGKLIEAKRINEHLMPDDAEGK